MSPWRAWLLDPAPASRRQARIGRWYRLAAAFARNRLAMSGLAIVLMLVLVAAFAPMIASLQAVTRQSLADRLQPMSFAHPFGTDELGRDVFARTVFGARITLTVVSLVGLIVVPLGVGVGLPAGFFGGAVDAVLMRLTDLFLAFPGLCWPSPSRQLGAGDRERDHGDRAHDMAAVRTPREGRNLAMA